MKLKQLETKTGRSFCVKWVVLLWLLQNSIICNWRMILPFHLHVNWFKKLPPISQVRVDGFSYTGMGNSSNKKDAQSNAARDFVNYLVRVGEMNGAEVPALGVRTPFLSTKFWYHKVIELLAKELNFFYFSVFIGFSSYHRQVFLTTVGRMVVELVLIALEVFLPVDLYHLIWLWKLSKVGWITVLNIFEQLVVFRKCDICETHGSVVKLYLCVSKSLRTSPGRGWFGILWRWRTYPVWWWSRRGSVGPWSQPEGVLL